MKNYTLTLLLTAAPLFAGTPAPVAPAPQYNSEQGWILGLEAMALRPYQSEGRYDNNSYDFAGRGTVGYQFADGLFVKGSYFGFGSDIRSTNLLTGTTSEQLDGRMSVSSIDLVVGQNFKPTETLKLSPYVGLRWGTFNEGHSDITTYNRLASSPGTQYYGDSLNFSGLGLIVGIDATRSLGSGFSLYGTAKESVLFGTTDTSNLNAFYPVGATTPTTYNNVGNSSDRVLFISELSLGVQYDYCFSNVAANIRLGVEGQWWGGASNSDSENTGLAGFVLGANFRF
ncbi:MAG: Lpg1974 family pore-forming outer membrane protein [Verrucomicrobiota bacterium]